MRLKRPWGCRSLDQFKLLLPFLTNRLQCSLRHDGADFHARTSVVTDDHSISLQRAPALGAASLNRNGPGPEVLERVCLVFAIKPDSCGNAPRSECPRRQFGTGAQNRGTYATTELDDHTPHPGCRRTAFCATRLRRGQAGPRCDRGCDRGSSTYTHPSSSTRAEARSSAPGEDQR